MQVIDVLRLNELKQAFVQLVQKGVSQSMSSLLI